VRHEDSRHDNGSSHEKAIQMRFGTFELDGFTTSVIEDDHQIKNAANEYHTAHYDLREVVKWGGVLFLFLLNRPLPSLASLCLPLIYVNRPV